MKTKSSPKKPVTETKAGSGGSYKSKEFISEDESSSDEDDDDKPLKVKCDYKDGEEGLVLK